MITLKQYLKAINYKITEGVPYCWKCYGPNAHYLDSEALKKYSCSAIFDRTTQVVYEVQAFDYAKNLSYRWMNPDYRPAHNDEAKKRGLNPDAAWSDLDHDYTFIDLPEDKLLKKIKKLVRGR